MPPSWPNCPSNNNRLRIFSPVACSIPFLPPCCERARHGISRAARGHIISHKPDPGVPPDPSPWSHPASFSASVLGVRTPETASRRPPTRDAGEGEPDKSKLTDQTGSVVLRASSPSVIGRWVHDLDLGLDSEGRRAPRRAPPWAGDAAT